MELTQRRTRLDAELVAQRAPAVMERLERVGLAAGGVERAHQLAAQPLAQRVASHLRVELGHQRGVVTEREVRLDPVLERAEPLLLQPRDLRLGEVLIGEVGERGTAPHRERLPEPLCRRRGITGFERGPAVAQLQLEAVGVQLARGDVEDVSAALCAKRAGAGIGAVGERPAQLRHGVLERLPRCRRRRLPPELVDQALGGDELVAMQEEQSQ